jgi:hypothetical protein
MCSRRAAADAARTWPTRLTHRGTTSGTRKLWIRARLIARGGREFAPADFTVRNAARLITAGDPWAALMPAPQLLDPGLVEEGRTIPVARVQAMHEGKRRARARRDAAR